MAIYATQTGFALMPDNKITTTCWDPPVVRPASCSKLSAKHTHNHNADKGKLISNACNTKDQGKLISFFLTSFVECCCFCGMMVMLLFPSAECDSFQMDGSGL